MKDTAEELLEGISEEYENPEAEAEDIGKKLHESGGFENTDGKTSSPPPSPLKITKNKNIGV